MMDDWKNLLRGIAPVLGTAIAGPLGGAAASFIAGKLGIEEKTVAAVTEALNGTKLNPDQIAQIKLAEIEFQKFLKENDIDLEKVHAADRAGARDMLKATGSYVPATLTFIITLGFFGILTAMFKYPEVKESAPLMIMLGALSTAWAAACNFWFGTTKNSQDKTHLLANSAPAK
jgi:hypothetical protein